jgi:hypothetical protein
MLGKMEISIISMENTMDAPQKSKNRNAIWSNNMTMTQRDISKGM